MAKCPKCGGTTGDDASGSLTQWIIRCQCQISQDQEADRPTAGTAVVTCQRCGKRKQKTQTGSFTQWVFGSSICDCDIEQANQNREAAPEKLDDGSFPHERYEINELIGRGASSQVYACRDKNLKKPVAVKLLTDYDPEKTIAFQNESKTLASLTHPAIVPVLDFSATSDGIPYMVMELAGGTTLACHLSRHGPLPIPMAVKVARAVCSGLAYAHEHNVYHRDIKPANIMVADLASPEPGIRIVDFGIALTKRSGNSGIEAPVMVGTPLYMSPDQAQGRGYDEQSEIYSVGCVIYEMVTGRPPFEAENAIDLIAMHAGSEPPDLAEIAGRSELSESLSEIVIACLAKDPEDRPVSMVDLELRLSALPIEPEVSRQPPDRLELESEPSGSFASLPPAVTGRPVRSVYAIGAIAALLTATAIGISLMRPPGKLEHVTDKGLSSALLSDIQERKDLSPPFVYENSGKVAISESTSSDADIERLAGERSAGKIKELRLINPAITAASIKWLRQLNLKTLWIKNSSGTMSSTQILFGEKKEGQGNEQLRLSDRDLESLLDGTGLTEIQLEGLPIEGTCFKAAAGSPFKKIRLMDCPISDAGLAAVADVGTPTWLCLRGADERFSGKGLSHLSQLEKLEILEISINKLEPGGATALGDLKNLTRLFIFCDRKLYQGELGFLPRLPRLVDLRIAGYCLTEDAIDSLAGLKIKQLTLRNSNLDDRLLSRLPPLPIETLILEDSLIEGKATESLARLKNLESIGVTYCRRLTPEGLGNLREALPGRLINRGEEEGRVEVIPYVPARP